MLNEIKIMRMLNHQHILKLYGVYESTNSIYLILELLLGGNLNEKIGDNICNKYSDVEIIMKSLLEAVDTIHN